MFVCASVLGLRRKVPQTGRFKQWGFILSRSGSQRSAHKVRQAWRRLSLRASVLTRIPVSLGKGHPSVLILT